MGKILRLVVRSRTRLTFDRHVAGLVALHAANELGAVGPRSTRGADVFLSLLRVVPGIRPQGRGGASGVVAGKVGNLLGLGVDDVLGVGDVRVDELFVSFVDEGG